MNLKTLVDALATAVGADYKALSASVMLNSIAKAVSPPNGSPPMWGKFDVQYPTSGNSPVVLEARYTGGSLISSLASFWLNENGGPRAAMAKASDSAMKFVGWGTNQSVPTIVVEQRNGEGTGGRVSQWGIIANGNPAFGPNLLEGRHVAVVPAGTTTMPAGTPSCIVYRFLS